jgi:hypothetical protein
VLGSQAGVVQFLDHASSCCWLVPLPGGMMGTGLSWLSSRRTLKHRLQVNLGSLKR